MGKREARLKARRSVRSAGILPAYPERIEHLSNMIRDNRKSQASADAAIDRAR